MKELKQRIKEEIAAIPEQMSCWVMKTSEKVWSTV
jgi:hypothetical protein